MGQEPARGGTVMAGWLYYDERITLKLDDGTQVTGRMAGTSWVWDLGVKEQRIEVAPGRIETFRSTYDRPWHRV
jgi:hypothetical protein